MVDNEQALKEVTRHFTALYPRMTPEAIVAFVLIAEGGMISLHELAKVMDMDQSILKQHLFLLAVATGAGLIAVSGEEGARVVNLSRAGQAVALQLNKAL